MIEVRRSVPLSGSHDPPVLEGVALVLALHAARRTHEGAFKLANHSGMREIKESGFAAFLVRILPYPPL